MCSGCVWVPGLVVLFFLSFCVGVDVLISGSGMQVPLLDRYQLVFWGAGSHDGT